MKKYFLSIVYLFYGFLLSYSCLQGQVDINFGKNSYIQNPKGEWYAKSFEQFDVYYYHDKDHAEATLRLAIKANDEISKIFEYKPYGRYQIRLYANMQDYRSELRKSETNFGERPHQILHNYSENQHGQSSQFIGENPYNVIPVFFEGSQKQFYIQLKTEIVKFYLRDMIYGPSRGSRSNRTNFRFPVWIYDGLPAFLSEDLSPDEISYLRSISPEIAYSQFLNTEITTQSRSIHKSFWYFVSTKFSTKKIGDLVYMMRLSRNIESGFSSSLGLTSETAVYQWSEWYRKEFSAQGYDISSGITPIDPTSKNSRIVSTSLHPKRDLIAYISESKGVYRLDLYDLKKKRKSNLVTTSAFASWTPYLFKITPVAYNSVGTYLAAVLPRDNEWILYLYGTQLTYFSLGDQFDNVSNLSFSPDGKNLLLSASKSGKNDLYLYSLNKNNITAITNDWFDDLFPTWKNDTTIIFSSNRDSILTTKNTITNWYFVDNSLDLYELRSPLKNKIITRLTNTPGVNETNPMVTGGNLVYFSDEKGVQQLFTFNDDRKPRMVTDFKQGVRDFHRQSKFDLFETFHNGKIQYFIGDSLDLKTDIQRSPHPIIINRIAAKSKIINNKDTEDNSYQTTESINNDNVNIPDSTDNSKIKGKKPRFYVFDDSDSTGSKSTSKINIIKRRKMPKIKEPEAVVLDINNIKLGATRPVKMRYYYQSFRIIMDWDAVFGMGLGTRLSAEAPGGKSKINVATKLYIPFQNFDFWGNFQQSHKNLKGEIGALYMKRYFELPQQYGYHVTDIYMQGLLGINEFQRISIRPSLAFFYRSDLVMNDGLNNDATATTVGSELSYIYDKVTVDQSLPEKGWRFKLSGQFRQTISKQKRTFAEVNFDLRKYTSLLSGRMNLALRFSGGIFLGPNPKTYYIGGVNRQIIGDVENRADFMSTNNVEDFYYSRFENPMHGFGTNARKGSQFALFNSELRIPIAGHGQRLRFVKSKNTLQLLIFYDLGTAWTTGNPLSQKNPIDATTITAPPFTISVQSLKSPFIMGGGVGGRVLLLGYFLRADVSWGLEESTIQKARFNLSLSREF